MLVENARLENKKKRKDEERKAGIQKKAAERERNKMNDAHSVKSPDTDSRLTKSVEAVIEIDAQAESSDKGKSGVGRLKQEEEAGSMAKRYSLLVKQSTDGYSTGIKMPIALEVLNEHVKEREEASEY